jgi:hypothetical protein
MPKYEVETTVVYRFFLEAPNQWEAESLGDAFENYDWELEVLNVSATETKEN